MTEAFATAVNIHITIFYFVMQHVYEKKRQEAALRESLRWEELHAAQQAEVERMQRVRESGLKGKQNKGSEHFNIISLEYHQTKEGQQLRYKVSGERKANMSANSSSLLSSIMGVIQCRRSAAAFGNTLTGLCTSLAIVWLWLQKCTSNSAANRWLLPEMLPLPACQDCRSPTHLSLIQFQSSLQQYREAEQQLLESLELVCRMIEAC